MAKSIGARLEMHAVSGGAAGLARECGGNAAGALVDCHWSVRRALHLHLPKIVHMLGVAGPPVNDRELLFCHRATLDPNGYHDAQCPLSTIPDLASRSRLSTHGRDSQKAAGPSL